MREFIRRPLALLILFILAALLVGPAVQSASAQDDIGDLKIELDLNMVLGSYQIFPAQVAGPIWQVNPRPGKMLVQLPFHITPGSKPVELGSTTFNMAAGRFICWRLNPYEQEDPQNGGQMQQQDRGLEAWPELTRELLVEPDGTVKYDMERRIPPNGFVMVSSNRLYSLKIERQALMDLAPQPPANTNSRDAGTQAAIARYRAARNDYYALRDRVNDLPDEFETDMPARVWAVFEVSQFQDDLDLRGPEPLPWEISFQGLRTLIDANQLVTAEGGVGGFGGELPFSAKERIRELLALYQNDQHIYTTRLIAYALHNSAVIPYAKRGESLFELLQLILTESEDTQSKRIVVKELITTIPPTSESRQLLAMAGSDMINSNMQFERLQSMVTEINKIENPAQMQEAVATANRVLADSDGPPPEEILSQLLEGAEANDAMRAALMNMRFNALPDDRRDRVIKFVLENAGTSELAANWLDTQLLGSTDSRLVVRTLEILRSADAGSPVVKPVIENMMTMVFGQASEEQVEDDSLPRPKITAPIPISTPRHSFFRAIQHGQSEIRDKAWACLSYFYFPPEVEDQGMLQQISGLARSDRYTLLIDAAMNQRPTPVSVVDFLMRQPEVERSTEGLVRIVLQGTTRASATAARALLGAQDRPVGNVLAGLSYGERQGFGMKMYQHTRGETPPVLPLLRHRSDRSPILPWFASQIAAGRLPDSSEWVEAFPTREGMLELVSSADPDLAKAAAIALVASLGGSEELGARLAQEFLGMADKSLVSLRGKWQEVRRSVYLSRLAEVSGPYRLSIAHGAPNGVQLLLEGAPLNANIDDVTVVTLGVIQMRANQTGVNFGTEALRTTVMENEFGIELQNPGEIKRLVNDPRLADIPLERATSSCNLRPLNDGSWRGSVGLTIGSAAIILEPRGQ